MIEFLQFTFQGFWHFIGVMILLGILIKLIVVLASIIIIFILGMLKK